MKTTQEIINAIDAIEGREELLSINQAVIDRLRAVDRIMAREFSAGLTLPPMSTIMLRWSEGGSGSCEASASGDSRQS